VRELDTAKDEGRFEEESFRVRKDGSRFWANVVITPMRGSSNELVGFVKVTRDLTERRKMEEERLRLAHAEEAIRLRDEFLSIASHELRTPLTALQLQLDVVRERASRLDATVARKVERAKKMGDRLARLIDTLLDVSRIATGSLNLNVERSDLGETMREVVERHHESAASAGSELSLIVDGPVWGHWDRLRIEQIATNLVSNALKYGAGQPIELRVAQDAETAVFTVSDRGPGIPDGDRARIFERFERAASTRHYGGMGLGLYIARQITEAHGGTIAAENRPGGGACFSVRLPLVSRASAERTGAPAA
jgi:signal transduction histidine kinase